MPDTNRHEITQIFTNYSCAFVRIHVYISFHGESLTVTRSDGRETNAACRRPNGASGLPRVDTSHHTPPKNAANARLCRTMAATGTGAVDAEPPVVLPCPGGELSMVHLRVEDELLRVHVRRRLRHTP